MAALVFFILGAGIRLLIGPISLNPISSQLSQALNTALPGVTVKFDEAALEWSRNKNRINLVILGARVFDDKNRLIAQAPKAAVTLSAGALFKRKVVVKSIALLGVQLTMVRDKDGALRLGLAGGAESDFLQKITDALSKKSSGASSLQTFAIQDARIAFMDEASGLFLVAPQANLEVSTGAPKSKNVKANLDALLEVSGHRAHVVMAIDLPPGDVPAKGDFSITGFSLRALGTNAKYFAALKDVDLNVDVSGSFVVDHGTKLKMLDVGFSASGTITDPRMPGGPLHLKSARATVRYDGVTGRLLLNDASIASDKVSAHAQGQGDVVTDANGVLTQVRGDLTVDDLVLNMPTVLPRPVALKHVVMQAGYAPSSGEIDLERVSIADGPLKLDVAGKIVLPKGQSPEIDVQGSIAALGIRDLLKYWPEDMAPGARDWIDRNISTGQVGPVALKTNIPAGALDGPSLPDADVNMTFPMSGITATYLKGLSPLTNARGNAVLTGNTFRLDVSSAQMGPLKLTNGHVIIADLSASGAVADITAHIDGSVPDVLALIDMKPLQYPTRFGIKTQGAKGNASIDASFKVPTVRDVAIDQVGIAVKAVLTDLDLSLGPHTEISQGNVTLNVNTSSLQAAGNVVIYGSKVALDWNEDFKTNGPLTSKIAVKGMLDAAARASLGLDMGRYVSGPILVDANLEGRRGKIQSVVATLDLTPATLTVDLINYTKAAGSPATAQIAATFAPDGAIDCQNIKLSGSGLSATGTASFDKDGALTALSLPTLHAGAGNDFGVTVKQTPVDGLDITIDGRTMDGSALVKHSDSAKVNKPKTLEPPSREPFRVSARLDRLQLRDNIALAPFTLSARGVGDRPETLSMSGTLPKGAKLTASITSGAGGRKLQIDSDNAGGLIDGLFSFGSIKGGTLSVQAAMPGIAATDPTPDPKNPPVDFQGTLLVKDFRVTNQPFLARLFAAGSLGGLIDLLGNQGIAFDKLEMPFKSSGSIIEIKDARAAGGSLGITADGYLDRGRDQVSIGGTLAPVYGLNSVLGIVPILGNLLVSKPGEGVIGMTYNVSGNSEEPKISVNPLSVLTPGIFRRIFEGTHVPPPQQSNDDTPPLQADPKPAQTSPQ
ncbi:MAG TPA: DUF3971 domain-containing protein [Rhizomicrobium sp.]|nr:DUF3971 domain-containing protein [Rhizomicrobium sp.]